MNHKVHLLAGITAGFGVGSFLYSYENQEQALIGGIACFLGAEFPDIDTGSIPSRVAARIGALSAIALIYLNLSFYAALIGTAFMIVKAQPHRGLTHSYLLPFMCFVLASTYYDYYSIAASCFGIGLIVHILIVDRINPFNPLSWLPFRKILT